MIANCNLEQLSEKASAFSPDAVCISIRNVDNVDSLGERTFTDYIVKIVKIFRESIGGTPIILGGSGFSLFPESILKVTGADYGVVGEGEQAVLDILAKIAKGEKIEPSIQSVKVRNVSGADYDPSLIEYYEQESHLLPVQTKRGCPFNCNYCSYPLLEGRRIRYRDPQEVIRELRHIKEDLGIDLIYFVDSVFNDPDYHYLKLLEAMQKQNFSMAWSAFLTPYGLTKERIELMHRTGLAWADVGGDGASDAALRGLGKNFTVKDIEQCCRWLYDKNIIVNNKSAIITKNIDSTTAAVVDLPTPSAPPWTLKP